jgi:hypothetical protein
VRLRCISLRRNDGNRKSPGYPGAPRTSNACPSTRENGLRWQQRVGPVGERERGRYLVEMARDWTGRDACRLQSALRLSNQELAERLGVGLRTVADWHARPDIRPRPETQRILDTALEQASTTAKKRFAELTGQPVPPESDDENQPLRGTKYSRLVTASAEGGISGLGHGFGAPEFGRLLLPKIVGLRDIRDPKSGKVIATYTDASILYYLIEHFVRVGAIDVAVNEGTYEGAIPMLPRAFRARLVEIGRADADESAIKICEPISRELNAEIEPGRIIFNTLLPNAVSRAIGTLVFSLSDYLQGMRHGLIVTMDLLATRTAIDTLLEAVSSRESRANLVTVEQVFSTYKSYEIGAPIIRSAAPARMVEIFDGLIVDPLYRELSRCAADMGAGEGAESVTAVTRAAKRLSDQDDSLNFGRYDAFVVSGRRKTAGNKTSEHFNYEYFPPIVPVGDAYVKARAAWRRDAPAFIPLGPDPEKRARDLPPDADLR